MATLSSDGKYVTVAWGDTLSEIASAYTIQSGGKTYQQLAKLNGISNPNKIKVGQKIYLTTGATSGNKSGGNTTSSNKAKNLDLGLVSNVEDQLLFTWSWSKDKTENYRVVWQYTSGDGVWFLGNDSTTTYRYSTYDIPSNAKKIRVRIKPIAKNKKVNNKETPYWTAEWSSWKEYSKGLTPIENPPTPKATIEDLKLTAIVEGLNIEATHIHFKVVKYDSTTQKTSNFKTVKSKITYPVSGLGQASMSCNVTAGYEYRVYCRALSNEKGTYTSDWVGPVDAGETQPQAPGKIDELNALSETSVQITWATVQSAETYDIEYTTEKMYFDSSSNTNTKSVDKSPAIIDGLETGKEYFFRVRATNSKGSSTWTSIKSVPVGKKPSPPTTWSSTTTAITGESVKLYWVHNSEDGSSQTWANLEIIVNGEKLAIDPIQNSTDEDEKDKTSVYTLNTSGYKEGAKIEWRVQTAGIYTIKKDNDTITPDGQVYSEWSTTRTIDVYAPPTLELSVNDQNGDPIETLTAFPFYVSGIAGPSTQKPIGYQVTVSANDTYETTDDIGNVKIISSGDSVYSNFFDITDNLLIELSAGNIDLQPGVNYTVNCIVSMDSGLTAEGDYTFNVSWDELLSVPNAEITIDSDSLLAYIRPYCEEYTTEYYKVTVDHNNKYHATTELLDTVWGAELEGVFTTTGEQVYSGLLDDETEVYYYESLVGALADDVTLSVYRRESDGTFTEIATGLDNTSGVYITDPHPALDYARYRIVGKSETTGTVTYYDVPGVAVGETSAVIQWDESWSNFDVGEDAIEDALEQPPWAGSIIKLPYNLDVSENNTLDVSLIEYIGRNHPVTYYGTQRGEKTSWNVVIEKSDTETLYALRRLKIWAGDVYVREPSGIGYWANIKVSFSQKHCDLTIPISLDITRVEGGI